MSMIQSDLLLGQEGGAGYAISRSLRFNSSDSAYLSRQFTSGSTTTSFTFSFWMKRGTVASVNQTLFDSGNGTSFGDLIRFNGETLDLYFVTPDAVYASVPVLRDPSAWYHVVIALGRPGTLLKTWINGVETYSADATGIVSRFGSANTHNIGCRGGSGTRSTFSDVYLADIYFVNGQALDPSSFGEFDANNIWQPKAYTGSYGTNGFHLDFADNSAATATTLGKDTSGNGNNWTPNNLSVTAGAGNDSLVDSPTNGSQVDTGVGGEVVGNYCTWNPLIKSTYATISNGNLDILSSSHHGQTLGTIGVQSGKWYWEVTKSTSGNPFTAGFGVMEQQYKQDAIWVGSGTGRNFIYLQSGGVNWYDGSVTSGGFSNASLVNDIGVWMFALDLDAQKMWFGKDGVWYSRTGTTITGPSSGLNAPFTSFNAGSLYFPFHNSDSTAVTYVANFGQRPFAYTAPSGFKALCTANLPTPTIANGATAMDVKLYTGNGSTQTISGLNFSPDLVWIKQRSAVRSNWLTDTVRGNTKLLSSDQTAAEITETDCITAFNSDGFSLDADAGFNASAGTYVAWTWDAGSSTVTNTQGSITSSVRASASSGFSVVAYSGNSTSGATIGHGLGIAPSLIIIKARNKVDDWPVYHSASGSGKYLLLNTTSAVATSTNIYNAAPTSTAFQLGADAAVNGAYNYVAYCWSPVAGYSSFGSYTGNGSADGPFVYTGFRPRWLLSKRTDQAGWSWLLWDSARDPINQVFNYLRPDLSNAETVATNNAIDFLSNGFKMRQTDGNTNASGGTYIYAAFAESPFAYARAR